MQSSSTKERAERHYAAGWRAAESGNWTEAIVEMDAAINLNANQPKYWVAKGDFLREKKEFVEAEDAIRKAIAIDANADYGWAELGLLFRDRKFYEEAASCYEKAAKLRPNHNVYTLLANVQLAFDPHLALANAEKALDLEPQWDEAIKIRESAIRQLETSKHEVRAESSKDVDEQSVD